MNNAEVGSRHEFGFDREQFTQYMDELGGELNQYIKFVFAHDSENIAGVHSKLLELLSPQMRIKTGSFLASIEQTRQFMFRARFQLLRAAIAEVVCPESDKVRLLRELFDQMKELAELPAVPNIATVETAQRSESAKLDSDARNAVAPLLSLFVRIDSAREQNVRDRVVECTNKLRQSLADYLRTYRDYIIFRDRGNAYAADLADPKLAEEFDSYVEQIRKVLESNTAYLEDGTLSVYAEMQVLSIVRQFDLFIENSQNAVAK